MSEIRKDDEHTNNFPETEALKKSYDEPTMQPLMDMCKRATDKPTEQSTKRTHPPAPEDADAVGLYQNTVGSLR